MTSTCTDILTAEGEIDLFTIGHEPAAPESPATWRRCACGAWLAWNEAACFDCRTEREYQRIGRELT